MKKSKFSESQIVAILKEGEAMIDACREFGISRKTGYKIFNRYKESGFESLSDRSRRPVRYANQFPPKLESLIVSLEREKPHWGARKIRELLVRRLDGDVRIPVLPPMSDCGTTPSDTKLPETILVKVSARHIASRASVTLK